jgi:hypothetical protein
MRVNEVRIELSGEAQYLQLDAQDPFRVASFDDVMRIYSSHRDVVYIFEA